jgi:hypothetical protein
LLLPAKPAEALLLGRLLLLATEALLH